MPQTIPQPVLDHIAATKEARKKARIMANAKYILRQWVAMTVGATDLFIDTNAPLAMRAAEELEVVPMVAPVPPPPPPVVP